MPAHLFINLGTVVLGAFDEGVEDDGPFYMYWRFNVTVFKDNEIVMVQGRAFPVVGGRLRIAHEIHQGKLSIATELVDHQLDGHAVVRATVETPGGAFTATGTATATRDPKLSDALLELAETRAVARALRFAGIGVECVGFEELGAGAVLEGTALRQEFRPAAGRTNGGACVNGNGNGNGVHHATPATTAQRRALAAITHRLGQDLDAVLAEAYPDQDPGDLSLAQASKLIDRLKGSNGTHAGQGR